MAFERKRAARIKRALAKLSEQQRQVIHYRFFAGRHLTETAAAEGTCDSSHRMRLMRTKRKLTTLIDADGYALSA